MKLILFLHVLVYSVSHTRNDKSCIKIHKSGTEFVFVSDVLRILTDLFSESVRQKRRRQRECVCGKRKDDKKNDKRRERKKIE